MSQTETTSGNMREKHRRKKLTYDQLVRKLIGSVKSTFN